MESLKLNNSFPTLNVELENGDTTAHYVLRGLSGEGRGKFIKYNIETLKPDQDGKATELKDAYSIQLKLLAMTMYKATLDQEGQPVKDSRGFYVPGEQMTEKMVGEIQGEVVAALFEASSKLSKINEAQDEAKND